MAINCESSIMRAPGAVDLRPSEGCFIILDASGNLTLATANEPAPLGCIITPGDKGDETDYALPNYPGSVYVRLHDTAGTVNVGTSLVLAGSGKVKAGPVGTRVAVALEKGENGALIAARLAEPLVVTA